MLFFKNPLFLYSLFSIVILILFHLIKRKNIKEVEFSSIMFILSSHKKISKKLKIKEFLLFLFRLIILVSIILLISNTSLMKKEETITATSSNQKIIVLDNNYQMLFQNGSVNDFRKAKNIIKEYFKDNSNSNFIYFKGEQHSISSISQLNEILDKIKITYDYDTSNIASFLETKSKFKDKEVIIISNYKDLVNGGNFKYSLIKHTDIDNQYIKEINVKQIEFDRYKVLLKVKSSSSKNKEKTISLYQGNKKVSQTLFTIEPNETKDIVISFSLPLKSTQKELEYKLQLENDDLDYDNKKFFIINTKKPKEILIVNGSMSSISYQDEAFYIKNALDSNENKYKFNITQKSWITSKSIKNYDLIMFLNNQFDDYDNQHAINEFLKGDKSVFISLGNNTNVKDFNYFWQDIISLRNFKNLEKTKENKFINSFNYEFKFLKDINFVKDQLSSYPIIKYYNLDIKQNLKIISSLNDGTPFIAEKILKKGKLIITSSSIDRDWNDFPLSTNFPPLMISIVKYLLEGKEDLSSFYIDNISKLKELNIGKTNNFKTGIYQHHNKIAYNTQLKRSDISYSKSKENSISLTNNNLLIPLKNWFIIIFMFMILLETLFFVKRFLWSLKNE